jgi:prepilin-type N-terminal cleavage/methylation domain-containing protein
MHSGRYKRGLTLIESLVSILLVSILLISLLGAFLISRISTVRAKNRIAAMNIIKDYMEKEMKGGYHDFIGANDGYNSVSSGNPFTVTVDNVAFTVTPSPYNPDTWDTLDYAGISYKVVGFTASWQESSYGRGAAQTCSERLAGYVSYHSSS